MHCPKGTAVCIYGHLRTCIIIIYLSEVPFQDLSSGKLFEASSTCGLLGPEEFFGDFPGNRNSLICDSSDPEKSYPPQFLSDADDPRVHPTNRTWWLSGNGAEEVSLVLNFEGFYFLYAVRIDFLPPSPSAAVIEVSQDFASSYHPLRYYSEDCARDFNLPDASQTGGSAGDIGKLICTSDFSNGLEELVSCVEGGSV